MKIEPTKWASGFVLHTIYEGKKDEFHVHETQRMHADLDSSHKIQHIEQKWEYEETYEES